MKSRAISVAAAVLLPCVLVSAAASRKPPLGWSSWYAMGQSVNQSAMEETYLRLTSRNVKPGDSLRLDAKIESIAPEAASTSARPAAASADHTAARRAGIDLARRWR